MRLVTVVHVYLLAYFRLELKRIIRELHLAPCGPRYFTALPASADDIQPHHDASLSAQLILDEAC